MNEPDQTHPDKRIVIIGAGPAGLTTAYELGKRDLQPLVLERTDKVGGISRTENSDGYYFDMGGHRFYTKSRDVNQFWQGVMGDDLLRRPRLSRIFYNGKFFDYPLKPLNALLGLGPLEGILLTLSYLRWQIFPYREEDTFEQWVTNRFGRRLFLTFFKTYTEKVWGISCSELKAEWAAQRIKGLSMKTALLGMFFRNDGIKTLIEEFEYPRRGPGMMWERVRDQIELRGGWVRVNSSVVAIHRNGNRIESVTVAHDSSTEIVQGTDFVSSMPIGELVQRLDPPPSQTVVDAAAQLKHRGFLTVCLIVDRPELFPDTWIYIHDPTVKVGRIQNFKNWSPEMVPDPSKTSLGLEYFCNEGDEFWNLADTELIELGKREIEKIGLADYADVEAGSVFRVGKAYPVYDLAYRESLAVVSEYVKAFENLQTIGRNGLHRYNNQDHAMMTAMLAVRNIVLGERNNLWAVNEDKEYLEECCDEAEIQLLEASARIRETLAQVFSKLEPIAFGLSVGSVAGVVLFLATLFLVLRGGAVIGPNFQLIGQFLPGYTVTWPGSLLGLLYGLSIGFVLGWAFASLRNIVMFFHLAIIQRRAELGILRRIFDYI